MSRKDQYRLTVSLDGNDLGVFDKMSGGEIDSDELKYKPGGMAPEISLGGSVSVGNVTVERLYDLSRDHQTVKGIIARVGKGAVTVNKQPLDVDGNAYGAPIVYQGQLKTCTPPEVDSEANDAATVQLEISSAGIVG
jgi:hypothetical protein